MRGFMAMEPIVPRVGYVTTTHNLFRNVWGQLRSILYLVNAMLDTTATALRVVVAQVATIAPRSRRNVLLQVIGHAHATPASLAADTKTSALLASNASEVPRQEGAPATVVD